LSLAVTLRLPVIIHNRDAHDDIAAILDEYHGQLAGCVMHCFAGGPSFVEQCVQWGCYISFAGNLTFPKATELRDAARTAPLDRLLVETDSPYLAPQPVRGKRCEPLHVRYTAECLANQKDISIDKLAEQTTVNARRLFGLLEEQGP
jgi:TatD DNase family protein